MNRTFKNLQAEFAKRGWAERHLFMRGTRFVKDGADILITRGYLTVTPPHGEEDSPNVEVLGWDECGKPEALHAALDPVCGAELADLLREYIAEAEG